jgi:glycine dehydrogenase
MCGMEVVVVDCDDNGNVDVADLKAKAATARRQARRADDHLPVHPRRVRGSHPRNLRHRAPAGGQVYMDGANLNAQVGLTSPATIGADVSHMNLHKTFCIPHGGGGPGMGPIGLAPSGALHGRPRGRRHRHRKPPQRRPGRSLRRPVRLRLILPISWMYITMMGGIGLKRATEVAILNANYVASQLKDDYPVLYTGSQGRVAHECILDIRPIKAATGISEVDIAKRLMDYGFHAPTMSFPVAGTIMVEPTESEDKGELDRFIAAMRASAPRSAPSRTGELPADNNPLKNAPTPRPTSVGDWNAPYSRTEAVFPLPYGCATTSSGRA